MYSSSSSTSKFVRTYVCVYHSSGCPVVSAKRKWQNGSLDKRVYSIKFVVYCNVHGVQTNYKLIFNTYVQNKNGVVIVGVRATAVNSQF